MILYKLTDNRGLTRGGFDNETKWQLGWVYTAVGRRRELCSDGLLHAYEHPLVAVFMNPIHADIYSPRMLRVRGEIAAREGWLKCGCVHLTPINWVRCPTVTMPQRIRFGIGCAWLTDKVGYARASNGWRNWVQRWLSGERDRIKTKRLIKRLGSADSPYLNSARAAYDFMLAIRQFGDEVSRYGHSAAAWAAENSNVLSDCKLRADLVAEWAVTEEPLESLVEKVA